MPKPQAASASARWGAETATTTLASPISTRPRRWAMATPVTDGHLLAISIPIRPSARSAIGR